MRRYELRQAHAMWHELQRLLGLGTEQTMSREVWRWLLFWRWQALQAMRGAEIQVDG